MLDPSTTSLLLKMILQNNSRRHFGKILINISLLDIFPTLLLIRRLHQDCYAILAPMNIYWLRRKHREKDMGLIGTEIND